MAQDVKIRISVDGQQNASAAVQKLSGDFTGLQSSVERSERAAASATDSLARMGTAVAGLAAATVSVTGLTRAADAWNQLNAQLKIATGTAESGAAAYADVLRIATATGQSLEQVGTVYRRFAENADALNLSQARVADISTTVAQAMALSGGSAESAQAALIQFGQALASGRLRGEELNSVMEQAPRLAQALADGLGISKGALRDMAADGELTSEAIVSALERTTAKVGAEFAQLPLTIGRALQNVSTAWTDTVGSFEKSTGAFSAAAGAINVIADNMGGIVTAGTAAAAVIGGRYVGAVAASTAATVKDTLVKQAALRAEVAYQQAMAQTALSATARTTAIAAATAAQAKLTTATSLARGALSALGGPIGLVTTALTLGATAWAVWGSRAEEASREAAASARENIQSVIDDLTQLEDRIGSATRKQVEAAIQRGANTLTETALSRERIQREMAKMQNLGDESMWSPSQVSRARELDLEYDRLLAREKTLQTQIVSLRDQAADAGIDAVNDFAAANAVGAQKIVADQEKVLAAFAKAVERTGGVLDLSNPEHARAYDALNAKLAEIGKSGKKAARGTREANDAIEDLLLKLDAKEIEEATKAVDDYNRAWSDYLGDLDKTARGLDEQIEQYGLTEAQIAAVTLRRAEDRLEMARASEGVQPDYLAALEREVELRRQIAGSSGKLEALDANARAAEEAARDWERTAAAIEDSLIDALMEGGKSGAEYIEGLFRSMVLRPVLQAIVSPVAGAMTGALGFAPPGASSSGVSMPMPSMGGLVGNGLLWAGGALGTGTALGGFATGMGTAFASGASTASTMAAGSSLMGTAGGGAAGAGMMAGAALPWVAAGLAIASMIDWGGGTPHAGAVVLSDGTTTSSTRSHDEVRSYYANPDDAQQFVESDFTKRYQQGVADALTPVAIGLAGLYNSTLSSFGLEAGYTVGLGFSADDDDASRGRFSIIDSEGNEVDDFVKKFRSDPEAGMAGFIDASAVAIRDALVAADLPGWVDSMLTDLGDNASVDSLNLALMQAQAIEDAAQTLGPSLGITAEGLAGVVAQSDSFDAAMAGLNTLSTSYLTAGEQWTAMQTAVADQFSAIGLEVPQSTDAFRRLLTEIDLTSEAGQDLYADLLNLAPAFLQVASAVEQTFATISQITATSVRDIEMAVLDNAGKYGYLDNEIDRLLEQLNTAYDPTQIQSLFEQINSKTTQAFNLLDEGEQKRLATQFIDRLYEAESLAQSRLSVTPIDYQPQQDAAKAQQDAAQKQSEAAAELGKAATALAAAINDMRGSSEEGASALLVAGRQLGSAASALAGAAQMSREVG